MDRQFILHLLIYLGIKNPEDVIDNISKNVLDDLLSHLTMEEIDEILQSMKRNV